MSTETDAIRLAEIGVRCERATEGPWGVVDQGISQDCYHISRFDEDLDIVGFFSEDDAGVIFERDADFIAHAREDVPWLLELTAMWADVLSAAARYEDADRQYRELRYDDAWHGHYKETLLEDRAVAAKDLCAAVAHLREGSGGTAVATEKGGVE